MRRFFANFLLIYFTFGSLCLPKGDFALLVELPQLFDVCEKTEHQGMNVVEFLTEHIINIGGLFDTHDDDDDQKAHKPFNFSHQAQLTIVSLPPSLELEVVQHTCFFKNVFEKKQPFSYHSFIPSPFLVDIFHPPIV